MNQYKEILNMSAIELNKKLKNGDLKFREITEAHIDRINKYDNTIGSFLTTTFDKAIEKSLDLQKRLENGEELSDIAGIPIGIKDNMCIKGVKTTCASKMLENYVPPYSATAVSNLLENDAILLGKLNMDEFAMGGSNENSYYKNVKNPWDITKVPGGSSGGSAACISSQFTKIALGSDTGGSIRQPASFCGAVGLKPTYGRVSRYGLIAFASSLDQIGPITKSVEDAALTLKYISGYDYRDSTSVNKNTDDYTKYLNKDISNLKIAYPEEYFGKGLSKKVSDVLENAFNVLKDLGVTIEKIKLPISEYAISAYYLISSAEASSNLARYDGIRYGYRSKDYYNINTLYEKSRSQGFGKEVKRRIMLGTYALSSGYYDAYYKKALKVRGIIKNAFDKQFEKYDAIISPVAPTTAYSIGEKKENPLEMYLGDVYTVSSNIAGLPAISVPAGLSEDNMPVGLQLIGKEFNEGKLLNIAYAFDKETNYTKLCPDLSTIE